ncbi:hypothetical protein Zmor_025601 [Zophobas morio]|uniref:Uncharacterized protein n=1 Tax=Zophobas morio TaxID=2755281 RepID=A0AA38HUE8_9CUCU|nr:hypothetical protein Zmor_025601 [Zophobas morio]
MAASTTEQRRLDVEARCRGEHTNQSEPWTSRQCYGFLFFRAEGRWGVKARSHGLSAVARGRMGEWKVFGSVGVEQVMQCL